MRVRLNFLFALAWLLCALPLSAQPAGDYWVLGSYAMLTEANREASRLGGLLGTDVGVASARVKDQAVYRVMLDYHRFERELVLPELTAAGIKPWRITLHESATVAAVPVPRDSRRTDPPALSRPVQPDANRAGAAEATYLLVTSVADIQESIGTELALGRVVSGVVSESRLEQGDIVHRVMVGPLRAVDVDTIRAGLVKAGFDGAEVITGPLPSAESGRGYAFLIEAARARLTPTVTRPRAAGEDRQGGSDGGYNFARLRPAPKDKNQQ